MPDTPTPDPELVEVVRQALVAYDDAGFSHLMDHGTTYPTEQGARDLLAAIEPALRAQIAGEIEADLIEPTENCPLDEIELAQNLGMKDAARIARGGRDG